MASERYLKSLEEAGVHNLRYLSTRHSRDSLLFASIVSTKDIKPPSGARTDYMLTFYMSDPSIQPGSVSACIFLSDIKPLKVIKDADIIVVRNFMLKQFNGQPQFSINRFSRFTTYKSNPLTCTFNKSYEEGPSDNILLKALSESINEQKKKPKVEIPISRPVLETAQIYENSSKFFDYVGQVIDIVFENQRATITLTDYTKNPKPIMEKLDESVVEKTYMIKCTVWDSLVDQCEGLKPGDYVTLKNCVKKNSSPLEFSIRNKDDEKKIWIAKIKEDDHPRLTKLIQRKSKFSSIPKEKKRKMYESPPLSTALRKVPRVFTSIKDINQSEELGLFQVQAYVADYEPKDIKEWMKGWCDKCLLSSSAGEPCGQCNGETEFIYRLSILLRDEEKQELKVNAFHKSAQELFQIVPAKVAFENEKENFKLKKMMDLATKEVIFMDFSLRSGRNKDKKIYQFARTRFILDDDEEEEE